MSVRAGCEFLYFGCLAAFAFVGLVGLLFWSLKRARKRLRRDYVDGDDDGSKDLVLGRYYIATWRDRLDYIWFQILVSLLLLMEVGKQEEHLTDNSMLYNCICTNVFYGLLLLTRAGSLWRRM